MKKTLVAKVQAIRASFERDNISKTRRFFQIVALIAGSIVAMFLGIGLVGIILIASPFLTVVILVFLAIYGVVSMVKS